MKTGFPHHVKKGEYGYLRAQRVWTLARTVCFFALSLGLFAMGLLTTHTKANLLTVVAVFGCLPASKSLVNTIMFFRSRGCSIQAWQRIEEARGSLPVLYDLYLTTYRKNFPISSLALRGHSIAALTEDAGTDVAAAQEHILESLRMGGHKGYTVKIFQTPEAYAARLSQMRCAAEAAGKKDAPEGGREAASSPEQEAAAVRTLLAIAL